MNGGDAGLPVSPTAELDGAWHFELGADGAPGRFGCDLTLQFGGYEVICASPDARKVISPTCTRLRADWRMTGSLAPGQFDGSCDLVEEFEGEGCAAFGYPSGIPLVTSEVALMTAIQTTPGAGEGFLEDFDGAWQFGYDETIDPATYACDVAFAGGELTVRCPGYPTTAVADCIAQKDIVVTATIGPEALEGAMFHETNRKGAGCEAAMLPLHETTEPTPMTAARR